LGGAVGVASLPSNSDPNWRSNGKNLTLGGVPRFPNQLPYSAAHRPWKVAR
jgi:hypothetical protein